MFNTYKQRDHYLIMQSIRTFYDHTLKQAFPPVRFAFAYGSAVVKQHGRPKGNMLDLVLAVDDPLEWHRDNLQWNQHHYSFVRHFGADFIVRLQHAPAAVYYNTLVMVESQLLKYGVISTKDLMDDLLNWKWLYVSGRLQKPVLTLTSLPPEDPLSCALTQNLRAAATCGVLLQNKSEFNEDELYTKIAELSYKGDFRQWIGEDKHKVRNIIRSNITEFSEIYRPHLECLVDCSNGQMAKKPGVDIDSHINHLPSCVQFHIQNGKSLEEALQVIVRDSSSKQSVKGILTAGMSKTVQYSFAKVRKMVTSYFN